MTHRTKIMIYEDN